MTQLEQTVELLQRWDNILVLTHKRPDGDTIGSGAALCKILRELDKTAWLLECQDATQVFQDYLKDCTAPADFVPEKIVSVDIADEGLFPPNAEPYKGKVDLAIDHHLTNSGFARVNWVEPQRAACGELIYALAWRLEVMTREIATLLYVALSTDTGCFQYSNTTSETHRLAAALMELGADVARLNKKHFRTKTRKRLQLESLIVQNMEFYQNDTIAIAPVSLETMASIGATNDDAEDIASFVGQVEGVLHGITIRESKPGECKISVRTDPSLLDASKVCGLLGGGGHAAAAGCVVKGSVQEAVSAILNAVQTIQSGV